MILNENTVIDYLVKEKKKKKTKLTREDFVREFNKEARKQKSDWYAHADDCSWKGDKFQLLHLSKKMKFMKSLFNPEINLHVGLHGGDEIVGDRFSFVKNDYVLGGRFREQTTNENKRIFRLLPEFKSILENIPIAFSILEDYSIDARNKQIGEIRKDIG